MLYTLNIIPSLEMAILESIKPFWPLLFTFVLPRAFNYYQALKTAYRTRPPPRPLSAKASRSLNVLFVSICIFLWLSLSTNDHWSRQRNVFVDTGSRLNVPTEVLFSRLALVRLNGNLTPQDEELRPKLTSLPLREVYLRYGPGTLLNCPFCHPDQPLTYLLHYLPTTVLFPHLLHLLTLGLATSRNFSGLVASQFRIKAIVASLALLILDIYATSTLDLTSLLPPSRSPAQLANPVPRSLHSALATTRPLSLLLADLLLAFLIYSTATGRFVFFPFLASASAADDAAQDPDEVMEKTRRLLNETSVALQTAQMKLRGLNVVRNTVVRDEALQRGEQRYWEAVRGVEATDAEGGQLDESVFEDEEVQAAMARAFGSGSVDVERMRREAKGFVDNVTKGLEAQGAEPRTTTTPQGSGT